MHEPYNVNISRDAGGRVSCEAGTGVRPKYRQKRRYARRMLAYVDFVEAAQALRFNATHSFTSRDHSVGIESECGTKIHPVLVLT